MGVMVGGGRVPHPYFLGGGIIYILPHLSKSRKMLTYSCVRRGVKGEFWGAFRVRCDCIGRL